MTSLRLLLLSMLVSASAPVLAETADEKKAIQEYMTQSQIEAIVKNYLLQNGGVIIEGLETYQEKQAEEQARAAEDAIRNEKSFLYEGKHPYAGNKDASVTLVEFFDYNCGYCKKALNDVTDLLDEDGDLRVVFLEVPILSPSSREVARWSVAAQNQEKYLDYHVKLMKHRGQYDEKTLEKLAKEAGLDVDQLKKDKASKEIEAALNENLAYMEKFGIRGTPSFIVDAQLLRGYVGKDQLETIIKEVRESSEKGS